MSIKRINMNFDTELLEVLDAFAAMNNRTRTYVVHELLMPSLPMLKELLSLSKEVSLMSDSDRLAALHKLHLKEDSLQELVDSLPGQIQEITND